MTDNKAAFLILQASQFFAQQISEFSVTRRGGGRRAARDPALQVGRGPHLPDRGGGAGGAEPQVHHRDQDHLLHHGGGQQRQAGHGPGGGKQTILGHTGRLLHQSPAASVQGEAVRREPRHHGLPGRQGAGEGDHQTHSCIIQGAGVVQGECVQGVSRSRA